MEDSGKKARLFIKPTDSDYVRLAKQGGEKDLLVSQDIVKSEAAKPYSKCEWFDHIHNEEEDARNRRTSNQVADKKVHDAQENDSTQQTARQEGNKIKEKYTRGGAPFHTDNMSVWERKAKAPETPEQRAARQARNPIY
uniref:uncharacterized protein C7orf57-like n=1 Tax=Styela clava TaxID=7725 RepID=UPI0019397997|nr:uncharacterized protein C7orf57-like [Styela clava]XP_039268257.1 uncharacterized protein C7orf57-like [Styela clava]